MENMFATSCEQTAERIACTVSGVCGKKPDELTCEMIVFAKVADKRTKNISM